MISEADYRKHRYLIWRLVWDLQSDGPGNPRFLSVRMSGNQNIYEFWSIVNWARAFSLAAALITWPGPWLWLAAGEKRYFVSDRRLRGSISSLTLGILLKYPFCFDLSFDWNCPEKIACDQNVPHQFLSNHRDSKTQQYILKLYRESGRSPSYCVMSVMSLLPPLWSAGKIGL